MPLSNPDKQLLNVELYIFKFEFKDKFIALPFFFFF